MQTCVILAGGKSSRMGQDKTLLPFGGFETLTHYQASKFSKVFDEVFISSKNQIDRILYDYENEIKNIVNKIKMYDPSVDNIYRLFRIQNSLSVLLYKYNYPLSDYLRDFIYEFDRQDEESVFYLIKEIVENKNFLNYG